MSPPLIYHKSKKGEKKQRKQVACFEAFFASSFRLAKLLDVFPVSHDLLLAGATPFQFRVRLLIKKEQRTFFVSQSDRSFMQKRYFPMTLSIIKCNPAVAPQKQSRKKFSPVVDVLSRLAFGAGLVARYEKVFCENFAIRNTIKRFGFAKILHE